MKVMTGIILLDVFNQLVILEISASYSKSPLYLYMFIEPLEALSS